MYLGMSVCNYLCRHDCSRTFTSASMLRASLVLGLLAPLSALAPAPKGGSSTSRRSALTSTLAALSTATLIQPSVRAVAAEAAAAASAAQAAESPIDVYFGCGCFWHVQHEFVEAERRILSRDDLALTSYAGYAGGKAGAKDGKVRFLGGGKVGAKDGKVRFWGGGSSGSQGWKGAVSGGKV